MRLLTLDIETKPHTVLVWSLHGEQHIALNQIIEPGGVICFAAKWHGSPKVLFHSDHHDGHAAMVQAAHNLISEADAVITYNGKSFDMKHLRWEMEQAECGPPAPWKDIDLYQTVRSQFRSASNKLEFISDQLGIGHKVQNAGMPLWRGVMADDPKAWAKMRTYCMGDVVLTEKLYDRILPWIKGHPNVNLYRRDMANRDVEDPPLGCTVCGSTHLMRRGYHRNLTGVYVKTQCQNCGKWDQGTRAVDRTHTKGIA